MMLARRLRQALVPAVLLAAAPLVSATLYKEAITYNSQVRWSSSVFPAKVISKECFRHPQHGYVMTRVVIECIEVGVKGDLGDTVGKRTTFNLLGGTKDGVTTAVADSPFLAVGDRAVFFLQKTQEGTIFLPFLGHSVVRIEQDATTGQDMVEVNWPVTTYGKATVGDLEKNARITRKSLASFLEDVKEVVRLEEERAKEKAELERRLQEQQQKDDSGR
ncbi:hypothetical protein HS125_02510 [bacterium]|nr:hypothetical protein [bacterium]